MQKIEPSLNGRSQATYEEAIHATLRSLQTGTGPSATYQLDRRAHACAKCIALTGAPAAVNPHAGLVTASVFLRFNGRLEWYRCRNCDTRWERLVSKFVFAAQRDFWLKVTL